MTSSQSVFLFWSRLFQSSLLSSQRLWEPAGLRARLVQSRTKPKSEPRAKPRPEHRLVFKAFVRPYSMDHVAWFLQIPRNPRRTSSTDSTTTVSMLASRLLRSSIRPSEPDDTPRRRRSRSVSWSSHVEVWQQPSRSVTWSAHVEVFIIPARECAPKDCDLQCAMPAMDRTRVPAMDRTRDGRGSENNAQTFTMSSSQAEEILRCASRASTTTGSATPPPEKKT